MHRRERMAELVQDDTGKKSQHGRHIPRHPGPSIWLVTLISHPRQQQIERGMDRQLNAADPEKVR